MPEKLLTFGHLEVHDVMVDQNDNRWKVLDLERHAGQTHVKIAHEGSGRFVAMTKPDGKPVTIDRDDPCPVCGKPGEHDHEAELHDPVKLSEAVATVKDMLGGQVLASVTDAQQATIDAATPDEPVRVPAFASMSMLQRRTHIFLLHGVIVDDLDTLKDLERIHDELTASPVNAETVPHVHE